MKDQLYFPIVESSQDVLNEILNIDRLIDEAEVSRKQAIANSHRVGSYCKLKRKELGNDLFKTFLDTELKDIDSVKISLCVKISDKFSEEDIEDLGSKEINRLLQGEIKSIVDHSFKSKPPASILDCSSHLYKFINSFEKVGKPDQLTATQREEAKIVLQPIRDIIRLIYDD